MIHYKRRFRTTVVLALLGAAGLSVSCDRSSSGPNSLGDQPFKVSLAAFNGTFVNFPIYVADALGLFQKHGLDVTIVYGTGTQVVTNVVSGSVNFGGFSVEHAIQLAEQGQDVKLLVLNQTATPFTIIVRNDVPLPHAGSGFPSSMLDLKGLKLAISNRGGSSDITLRFLLKQAGLNPDRDVTLIPVGEPGPQIAALANGQVDGSIAFEPIQTQAVLVMRLCKPVLDLEKGEGPSILADYAFNGIATRGDYLKEHREEARRLVAAIVDAERAINDEKNLDQMTAIAADAMRGIDRDALRQYLKTYSKIFRPAMTKSAFANVNQVLVEAGMIKQPVPYEAVTAMDLMPTGL